MTYEGARNYILQNWFDGDENADSAVFGDDETMAMKYAVEVLNRAISKKPIPYDKDAGEVLEEYNCPECNAPYDVLYDGKLRYCPNCGQRMDWSE